MAAPEYASSGKLTEKSDVFSFGVMLLEFIIGRRPVDPNIYYMDLVDPRLEQNYSSEKMAHMVACAAASIRHSARRRPKMSQGEGEAETEVRGRGKTEEEEEEEEERERRDWFAPGRKRRLLRLTWLHLDAPISFDPTVQPSRSGKKQSQLTHKPNSAHLFFPLSP
ncbi:hypothetical protein Droror1_Dr00024600 [Drosera rotundifolia]